MPKLFDENVSALLKDLAAECERAGVQRHNVVVSVAGCQVTFDITPDAKYTRTEP